MIMTKIHTVLFALCMMEPLAVMARTYTVEEVPNVQLADSTRLVSDPDGLLQPSTVAQLDAALRDLRRRTTVQTALVAVSDVEGGDPDGFATELFEHWGIGNAQNDNGLLILYVPEQRAVVIRTGQGVEGALPDVVAGRILRNDVVPLMRDGEPDRALIAAVKGVDYVLSNPAYADELRAQTAADEAEEWREFVSFIVGSGIAVGLLLALAAVLIWFGRRKRGYGAVYDAYRQGKWVAVFVTMLFVGLPVIGLMLYLLLMRRARTAPRRCDVCGHRMERRQGAEARMLLNPMQQDEALAGSVDYDVWQCPGCGHVNPEGHVRGSIPLKECPACHARLMGLQGSRVTVPPTTRHPGEEVKTYRCRHCGHTDLVKIVLPMLAGGYHGGPGHRGGGFGGGGFGGGSFGGGSTMGGGATGRW